MNNLFWHYDWSGLVCWSWFGPQKKYIFQHHEAQHKPCVLLTSQVPRPTLGHSWQTGNLTTRLVTHQLTDFSDYFALVAGARQRSLPSVLPRGGVGMGGRLCWGAHDCLHSGFNILFFSTLLLYFRESSCPLEFW